MPRGRPYPFKSMQRRALEFLRKCKPASNGCLEFQGRIWSRSGHVQYRFRDYRSTAHRFIYSTLVADPGELHVLHTCDNPICMNIDHLWLGTQRDNSLDMARKGRTVAQQRTHCPRGHDYAIHGTRYGKDGWRNCKICHRGTHRVRAGWPVELAFSVDPVPSGRRPVNASWKR